MKNKKLLLLLAIPFMVACNTGTSDNSSSDLSSSTTSSISSVSSDIAQTSLPDSVSSASSSANTATSSASSSASAFDPVSAFYLDTYAYQGDSFPAEEVKAFLGVSCTIPSVGGTTFYGDEINSMYAGNYYDVAVLGYTQADIAAYYKIFQDDESFETSTITESGVKVYNAVGDYQVIFYEYSGVLFLDYYQTVKYDEYDHFPLAEAQEYLGITDSIPAIEGDSFLGLATYYQSSSSYYNVFEILVENPSSTLREEYAATVTAAGYTCTQDGTTYTFETENAICLFDYSDEYFILDIYVPYVYEGSAMPSADINKVLGTSITLPNFEGENEYTGFICQDSYGDTYYQIQVAFDDDSCVEAYATLLKAAGFNPTKEHNTTNDLDFYYEDTTSYYYQFYYNTTYSVFVFSIWGA